MGYNPNIHQHTLFCQYFTSHFPTSNGTSKDVFLFGGRDHLCQPRMNDFTHWSSRRKSDPRVPNSWDSSLFLGFTCSFFFVLWMFLSPYVHPYKWSYVTLPIGSMYGVYTYIWLIYMVNVAKYTIHGYYGLYFWGHLGPNKRISVNAWPFLPTKWSTFGVFTDFYAYL